ncbi:MAG TPA: ATP-binding protein [Phenylobacterium sp.]
MRRAGGGNDAPTMAGAGMDVRHTAYELTLGGLQLPVHIHYVFNLVAAAGFWLLGHPLLAFAMLASACIFDTCQQILLKHWLAKAADADEAAGFRKLALLCVARIAAYTTPTAIMAWGAGLPEYMLYGLQLMTLLMVATGLGALSRTVFWGLAGPVLLQIAALIFMMFDLTTTAALMTGFTILATLLVMVSENSIRTSKTWHAAFVANTEMVRDLAAARDQAISEHADADAAREAARAANSAKSNFLATMSHEIRTPMNGVLGMAQLMKRVETDPVQAGRLDVLIDSGEYLLSILNDILDVSKIDAGKLEIVPAAEDLHALLDRLVSFWAPRADERGVQLELARGPGVPQVVWVDALRLRQVLFNLVGNALKFTDVGLVQVIAEALPCDDGRVRLHLAVRDTGPGIARQHLPQLFDRFSQANEADARRMSGTGLGLAIVKQLVELMDGRVWVESELGQGSTFHVEIAVEVAAHADVADLQVDEPETSEVEALRILAVDDNAVNLLVLDQLLTSLGHTVAKAASGAEALRALGAETFDLVLTDIQMPGLTGLDVLETLRLAPGPNQAAPVIALTADVTSGGRQSYLDQGFTEHAAKPIQLQELLSAIARAIAAEPSAAERAA